MNSKTKPKSKSSTPSSSTSNNNLFSKTHDSLAPLIPILTSFAHRNHNQHRTSHWWSSFNIFRRSLRNLDAALLKRKDVTIHTHASWMSSHVIPRAYVAFTQLTADNQHAPLGLMLVAVLGNVATLLSDLVPAETPISVEAKNTPLTTISTSSRQHLSPSLDTSTLDRGVTISREEITRPVKSAPSGEMETVQETRSQPQLSMPKGEKREMSEKSKKRKDKEASKDPKPKKKKKKAGDDFSSLFGSLS